MKIKTLAVLALTFLALLLLAPPGAAAERITATITITNAPTVDGDNIDINGDVRTWTNLVADSSSQILTNDAIGGVTTNLYQHLVLAPPVGPLQIKWIATNQIELLAQVDGALAVTIGGTWAEVSFSTQAVTRAYTVRVPFAAETAAVRTNNASLIVTALNDYAQNSFSELSVLTTNLLGLTSTQTVSGPKEFTGLNLYSNAQQKIDGGYLTNIFAHQLKAGYNETNAGVYFLNSAGDPIANLAPDSNGKPGLWAVSTLDTALSTAASYTPDAGHILNRAIAANYFGSLDGANTWGGTNTFAQIYGSAIWAGTILDATITDAVDISGTVDYLAGGTYSTPVLTNAVHIGAFQSYDEHSSNVEIGSAANVEGGWQNSIALGKDSVADGSGTIAIGQGAEAHAGAVVIGALAASTEVNQLVLGGPNIVSSIMGNAANDKHRILGNLTIGTTATLGVGNNVLVLRQGTAPLSPDALDFSLFGGSDGTGQYVTGAENLLPARIHNRASQLNGGAGNYTLTTSYADVDFTTTDPYLALPSSGTYLLIADVTVIAGASANDEFRIKFHNSTDATDVTATERIVSNIGASQRDQMHISATVTVGGAKTVKLQARNSTAARGSLEAATTSVVYVRLH